MPKNDDKNKLLDARKRKGWSQEQAARHLLISKSFYQKLELGERNPGVHLAIIINMVLDEDIYEVDPLELSA